MITKEITFNELPQMMAMLYEKVCQMDKSISTLLHKDASPREDRHIPMSAEEAADYLKMPKCTLYEKVRNGILPTSKPGKRYIFYKDELDKWVEVNRRGAMPQSDEEINASLMAGSRRKPSQRALDYGKGM